MSQVSLIPSLQADALVREIEQQLRQENRAIAEQARREAQTILNQARAAAREQVHKAIEKLREEGTRRTARAKAQLETASRTRAQREAAQAVRTALPLLHGVLIDRWREAGSRKAWYAAVAHLCARRLAPGTWLVAHPQGWSATEQKDFAVMARKNAQIAFDADAAIAAGLRVSADQAVLDATPQGLLGDATNIAALLLEEIGAGA